MTIDLQSKIRDIPDFPREGIVFKDLTPIIGDAQCLAQTIQQLAAPFRASRITRVAGMEARGFIFGSLVAYELQCGFVPLRKAGKLPFTTVKAAYSLEYGTATLEMHTDALVPGDRVLLVDDLIATGGTAAAGCELVQHTGATIVGCAFVIELAFLNGRKALAPHSVHALIRY